MRNAVESEGPVFALASPQHGEEGCLIFVFMLCEFARVLEQDTSHYCSAESRSCTFMRERRRGAHLSAITRRYSMMCSRRKVGHRCEQTWCKRGAGSAGSFMKRSCTAVCEPGAEYRHTNYFMHNSRPESDLAPFLGVVSHAGRRGSIAKLLKDHLFSKLNARTKRRCFFYFIFPLVCI